MSIYKITTKENEILFTCHVEIKEDCVDDIVNKVNIEITRLFYKY